MNQQAIDILDEMIKEYNKIYDVHDEYSNGYSCALHDILDQLSPNK